MKITKEEIIKRLQNWKTWVALFSLIGLLLKTMGYGDFTGQLGQIQDAVYTIGSLLGLWTTHGDGATGTEVNQQG
ncbi:hypothetical protein AB1283_25975 [Bacillus sp. S13(2024)]|uniref:hypothetical protein n=1 Tax=Bacillus sp. S13(2024) TaxID=3162885 RepID=UPI003D23D7A7